MVIHMNKTIKIASIIAGFILVVGALVLLSQDLASRSGVSATYPLAGQTIAIPLYLWNDFSAKLEALLTNVAKDSRYQAEVRTLQILFDQIKPLPEPKS